MVGKVDKGGFLPIGLYKKLLLQHTREILCAVYQDLEVERKR